MPEESAETTIDRTAAKPASKPAAKPAESKAQLLDFLLQMHEIRNFEDTVYKLLREGTKIGRAHV